MSTYALLMRSIHLIAAALLGMERLRPVDAGAHLHLVVDEEGELLLVHEREVAHHRELELLAVGAVAAQRVPDDVLDDLEIDERLTTLELDRERGRGRRERQVDRLLRRLLGHVRIDRVHVGSARMAIDARLVAAQRHDHHVEVRPVVEEPLPPPQARPQGVDLGVVEPRADEVLRGEALVEGRARREPPADQLSELRVLDEDPVAHVVGEQHVTADLAEAERHEIRGHGRRGRSRRELCEGDHRSPCLSTVAPSA
jgi:hypothetical protein